MAIPFSLPSDETTLEQYRGIHRLLLDLMSVLRTLMSRNPELLRPNNLSSSNENAMSPAVSPAFQPTPQFVFPLSPPNSQPGSPSPFFSATAGSTSAFVLPDVVTSSRTNNSSHHEFASPTQSNATANTYARVNGPVAVPYNVGQSVPFSARVLRQKLGKRKRARFSRNKKLIEATVSGEMGCVLCERQTKIPRRTSCSTTAAIATTTTCSLCSCSGATFDNNLDHLGRCCSRVPDRECCSCPDHRIPICMHISEELRKIVESFRNPRKVNGTVTTEEEGDVKGAGLLSQFGRTMFTAALLVIGWKLLKQN